MRFRPILGYIMKEKLDLFAKGVFSYSRPGLLASTGSIGISVEIGKLYKGSFSVSASDNSSFKGIVYSTDTLLKIDTPTFVGSDNVICYTFDAGYLDVNDSIKGRIVIVSELGELEIPFHAKTKVPAMDTSVGPASDLYHYANLARTDWEEAKNLFKTEEFRRTLLYFDSKYDTLYRTLSRGSHTSFALEEFLIASRKKKPVSITAETLEKGYDVPEASFTDSITLHRDSWGFCCIGVETEGDFLSVPRKLIWGDDFLGNNYELEYIVDRAGLHRGKNFGTIILKTYREELRISIIVRGEGAGLKSVLARRKRRFSESALMANYIEFRAGRMNASHYIAEAENILNGLRAFGGEDIREKVYRIHLLMTAGKENLARNALSAVMENDEWQERDDTYAAVLFYEAALSRDQNFVAEACVRLRELHAKTGEALAFIFAMQLDRRKRIGVNQRFDTLRNNYIMGDRSPLLLLESMLIANEEPSVLRDFSGFPLHVINFGVRHKLISRNAVQHAAYLATRERQTGPLTVEVLRRLFVTCRVNEVLEPLCMHIVASGRDDRFAYKWLSVGINEQIRVNGIYEHCIAAAKHAPGEALPAALVNYFENEPQLPEEFKLTLYSNLISFRSSFADSISLGVMSDMKEFALAMLRQGRLSAKYALLYNSALDSGDIDVDAISKLPDVVFKYEFHVDRPNIAKVLVSHKELSEESAYEVVNGIAMIDIFTTGPVILLEDRDGNRIWTEGETPRRMVTNPELINLCMQECRDDARVKLAALENARYKDSQDQVISLLSACMDIQGLEQRFELECRRELIEYYYDNLEGDLMESFLVSLDLSLFGRRDRARLIDLMILRELYSLAVKNMEMFGFTGVDVKRLVKLASRLIETDSEKIHDSTFLDICCLIFRKHKYNDCILKFLLVNYSGDTDTMYGIWRASIDAGLDTTDIEEKLLCQLLFIESDLSYSRDIFRHYYGHGPNRKLIRAYLSYYAYGYLVNDRYPDTEFFDIMARESEYEENDICFLALLKYYSVQTGEYTDAQLAFISKKLEYFERKGMLFPFFRNFAAPVQIPFSMHDKYYVEYHTDMRNRVRINYCLTDGTEDTGFVTEDMTDKGYGIFIKEFTLFYGEMLQYYISEEKGGESVITESCEVSLEPELIGTDETRYHQLNLIITAREMNDNKTMQKLLENYIKNDYICKRLFKPL